MIKTSAMFLLFVFAWAGGVAMVGAGIASLGEPAGWLLPAGVLIITLAVLAVVLGGER